MPARLRPTAPIAADAILVGDPGRALMLAQELLRQPKMSNHARGLWGYTGETAAGAELTIQSTGMGGPSAGVVLRDLAELGVRRAVRIGTCSSLGHFGLGDLVVVAKAVASPPRGEALPDPGLTAALERSLGEGARRGTAISLDALHRHEAVAPSLGGDVADMQTAALLTAGAELGMKLAAALVVTDAAGTEPLGEEELASAAKRAGAAAASILSS